MRYKHQAQIFGCVAASIGFSAAAGAATPWLAVPCALVTAAVAADFWRRHRRGEGPQ
jgi:hypothetical protein